MSRDLTISNDHVHNGVNMTLTQANKDLANKSYDNGDAFTILSVIALDEEAKTMTVKIERTIKSTGRICKPATQHWFRVTVAEVQGWETTKGGK